MDCFVNSSYIYETVPIVNAHKTYPQWWLDLPLAHKRNFDFGYIGDKNDVVQKNNNMKNCYGFLEYYKKGAVVECWSDLVFKVGPAGYKFFSSCGPNHVEHSVTQRGLGFKNYHHIKLSNPWLIEVKEDVKFLFSPATWNLENYDFVIPPGVLNFKVTNVCHINVLLPAKKEEFVIPIGQPLVHLIPLSDKNLNITNHLISEQEYKKKVSLALSSFFGWRRKLELLTRSKKREELKCPFS